MLLNLIFLFSIILLPVSNGLHGNYGASNAVAVLYGLHLTVIAALNAWLWWLAIGRQRSAELVPAIFPVLMFLPGTAVALVAPQYAQYFWLLAFGALLMDRFFRERRAA